MRMWKKCGINVERFKAVVETRWNNCGNDVEIKWKNCGIKVERITKIYIVYIVY